MIICVFVLTLTELVFLVHFLVTEMNQKHASAVAFLGFFRGEAN